MTTDGMAGTGGAAASVNSCVGNAPVTAAGNGSGRGHQQLTWEKLSPEEFQQLQDFAACEFNLLLLCSTTQP